MRATVPEQRVAGAVEIHQMAMNKGIMWMRPAPGVDLPAGRTVELKLGGRPASQHDCSRSSRALIHA